MKEDSDDCILQRRVFSTLVTGAHPIPLLREDLIPPTVAFNLNEVRNLSWNHRRGERGPSGIIISRRPKSRASSEKEPGPSKTRAADIAARLKAANALTWLFAPVIKNDETPVLR
jgi:hypothetical protein